MELNVFNMKNIIILFFLSPFVFNSYCPSKEETLEKFITKHYQVPKSLRKDCNWNFLALELTLNKEYKIQYKIKNTPNSALINSIEFIKDYKVNEGERMNFPALIFINVQNESGECNIPFRKPTEAEVSSEILKIVTAEMKIYPHINILEPITSVIGMIEN